MRCALIAYLGFLLAVSFVAVEGFPASGREPGDRLRSGMTPQQVREVLGPPRKISREVILHRAIEQWHYTNPSRRLTFEIYRGRQARLVLPPS